MDLNSVAFPRRELLRLAALSGLLAGGASGSCSRGGAHARDRRVFVHVELRGGNDGLNCVVPYADSRYRSARPLLGLSEPEVCRIDGRVGFHHSFAPLLPLWNRGRMAVVQSVGCPRPDRSHFFTRRVWATGDPQERTLEGWLGRLLEQGPDGWPVCVTREPLPLCTSARVTPCVVQDLSDLELAGEVLDQVGPETLLELLSSATHGSTPYDSFRHASMAALESSRRMAGLSRASTRISSTLRERLDTIAALIELGIGGPVYAAMLEGFDTHASQMYRHAGLVLEFAEAVAAFFERLERSGCDGQVLLVAWSEFGRRVAENGAGGTDHGLAGPAFAFGPGVAGGLYGPDPDLSDLDEGDMRVRVDLRRLAADVAAHLDLDLAAVLGPGFRPVGFVS
jgi:uncharacterized protein (DUF1501 family)